MISQRRMDAYRNMEIGLRYRDAVGSAYLWVARTPEGYTLGASWRVMEKFDETCARGCGCPLYRKSHAHAERRYAPDQVEEMAAAWAKAWESMAALGTPKFAKAERCGGTGT